MQRKGGAQKKFQDAVLDQLKTIHTDVKDIKRNVGDIIETQAHLVATVITHEELRTEVTKAKQELMDHTTKECAKVQGNLVSISRKIDGRTDTLTTTLHEKKLLSASEKADLFTKSPFRSAEAGIS